MLDHTRDRGRLRRRGRRLPPGLPARPRARGGDRRRRRAARASCASGWRGRGARVPFGVEVMGRVRELGSLDDVLEISARVRLGAAGARLRAHARDSRRRLHRRRAFAEVLEAADDVLEPGAPFHIHFSDIAYANRNETKHLPYGEGTLRAEPLARRARAVRAAGDGDHRVARRGVDSGDPGARCSRAPARRLGELAPRSARASAVAAAVAQEAGERLDGSQPVAPVVGAVEDRRAPRAAAVSASSSRPCAARTIPSAIRVVAREMLSCGPTVSAPRARSRSASSILPLLERAPGRAPRWLSQSVPRSSSGFRIRIASRKQRSAAVEVAAAPRDPAASWLMTRASAQALPASLRRARRRLLERVRGLVELARAATCDPRLRDERPAAGR